MLIQREFKCIVWIKKRGEEEEERGEGKGLKVAADLKQGPFGNSNDYSH